MSLSFETRNMIIFIVFGVFSVGLLCFCRMRGRREFLEWQELMRNAIQNVQPQLDRSRYRDNYGLARQEQMRNDIQNVQPQLDRSKDRDNYGLARQEQMRNDIQNVQPQLDRSKDRDNYGTSSHYANYTSSDYS